MPNPNDPVVLGIHSTVNPGTEGSFNQLTDGHAWISVTRNGQTQVYGLWPDAHPNVPDNGRRSDIRTGLEAGYPASASRYYALTAEQAAALELRLRENVTWGYGNTCASWASDTARAVTGERVQGGELLGLTDTPRKLIESINALERQRDTTPSNPLRPDEIRRSSSFGALSPDELPAQERSLYARAERAVTRDLPGANANVAANLALLARENAMDIDHVVRGNRDKLFIVQGALEDPTHRRAAMPIDVAEGRDAARALEDLRSLAVNAEPREASERLARMNNDVPTPAGHRLQV